MRGAGEEVGPRSRPGRRSSPCWSIRAVAVETPTVFRALDLRPGRHSRASRAPGDRGGLRCRALLTRSRVGSQRSGSAGPGARADHRRGAFARAVGTEGCRLARMSGSGATVFGLYADCRAAVDARQGAFAGSRRTGGSRRRRCGRSFAGSRSLPIVEDETTSRCLRAFGSRSGHIGHHGPTVNVILKHNVRLRCPNVGLDSALNEPQGVYHAHFQRSDLPSGKASPSRPIGADKPSPTPATRPWTRSRRPAPTP